MKEALLAFFDLILILFLQDLYGRSMLRHRLKRLDRSFPAKRLDRLFMVVPRRIQHAQTVASLGLVKVKRISCVPASSPARPAIGSNFNREAKSSGLFQKSTIVLF